MAAAGVHRRWGPGAWLALCAFLLAAACPAEVPPDAAPEAPRTPAPGPELAVAELGEVTADGLSSLVGERPGAVTLVAVWATWCAPCLHELAELRALHREREAEGLRVIGLCLDDRRRLAPQIQQVLDRLRPPYEMRVATPGSQEELIRSVVPKWDGGLPLALLYDRSGALVETTREALDRAAAEALVGPLLEEAAP